MLSLAVWWGTKQVSPLPSWCLESRVHFTQRTTVTHSENSGKVVEMHPNVSHPNEKTSKFFPQEMTFWLKSKRDVRGICRI